MHIWILTQPTEENQYRIFDDSLESDANTFFHATAKRNLQSIVKNGFCSSIELGVGNLESVSYAVHSTECLSFIKNRDEDTVVFAVRFTDDQLNGTGIKKNNIDIHVYRKDLQPEVLGYCEIPAGFKYS